MKTDPGQVFDNFDLQLTKPAVVRGRVTFAGKPIANRDVRTHDFEKHENRYYDPTVRTADDGTFELKFVRPGKHYLQVEPFWLTAEQAPRGSIVIEVKAGEVLEGIELQSAPPEGGVVEVPDMSASVVDQENRPVAGIPVIHGLLGATWTAPDPAAPEGVTFRGLNADEDGLVKLPLEVLRDVGTAVTLVYAVDVKGKRAGISVLNARDYAGIGPAMMANAGPEANVEAGNVEADFTIEAGAVVEDPVPAGAAAGPLAIDVVLAPASLTTIEFSATAFRDLKTQPEAISVTLMRDSLPLLNGQLAAPGTMNALLPAGDYEVAAFGSGLEMTRSKFTVGNGEADTSVTVELQPSRLARLIGQPAPGFQQVQPLLDDDPPTLDKFAGKVIVLDFWGSWCGPCIAAMPELMKLHDEFHDRGVEFIAIHDSSIGTMAKLDETLKQLAKDQWQGRMPPFPVLLDGGGPTAIEGSELQTNGATTAAYGVTSFPTTLLIDRQGRVHGQLNIHDAQSARDTLEEVLN